MSDIKIKKIIYICLLVFLIIPLISFAKKKDKPLLTWKKIKNASYYIVEIKNKKGKIIRKETVESNQYFTKLKEGEYKIRITGYYKSGRQHAKSKWSDLKLKKALKPEIKKVKIKELTIVMKRAVIKIKGKNFLLGTRVFLRKKNKTLTIKNIKLKSKSNMEFTISPKKLGKGNYDIILINPGGKKSEAINAFTIKTNKPASITIKKEKRTGLLHANGLYLAIGYQYGFILPDWDQILDNSFLGINMVLFYDLGGFKKISRIKVLRNFGFALKGSYAFHPEIGKTDVAHSKLQIGTALAGIHYKNNFSLPIYFIFRIFCGMTFTTLKKEKNNNIRTISSTDIAVNASFSILYKFKKNYFLEFGTDYLNSFFAEKEFRSLGPYFRIGFIF